MQFCDCSLPPFFIPPLIRSIKTLLFGYPDIFGICLIKQKFLKKHTFYILILLSPIIRAKRVRVIKDKICILKIQDTFVLSRICQKCQGTQIKAFLCFKLKEEYKGNIILRIKIG